MSPLRHLVPLTDLKPVNPVPAWNVAASTRKGDLGMFALRSFFLLFRIFLLSEDMYLPLSYKNSETNDSFLPVRNQLSVQLTV